MIKQILATILSVPMIISSSQGLKVEKEAEKLYNPYFVEDSCLYNYEDGYKLSFDDEFILNDEFYPNNLRLESLDTVIEVYTEDLKGAYAKSSYINYNNQAITKNKVDYKNVRNFVENGVTVLSWEREKLSKIINDKNHYVKLDFKSNNEVYTVLIKSQNELDYTKYLSDFEILKDKKAFEKFTYPKRKPSGRKLNEETEKLYKDYFLNQDELEWGIFHPDYLVADSLNSFENEIEHEFPFLLWYTAFYKTYDRTRVYDFLQKAYKDGKIVELTLQPSLVHAEGNDIFRVLNGEYDAFLTNYANDVAYFDHPVIFRLANEMNGDWCEYSGYQLSLDTEIYREFYKYVYSFFEKAEADNVLWVWNPNGKSFPDYNWNHEDLYYPGDEYVDIMGLTLYNTGTFYKGETWTSFYDLYKPLYDYSMTRYDMPFMITEFACARHGGDKEAWTRKMLSEIEAFDNIKLAVWWNGADYTEKGIVARAYFINDSAEMTQIFKNYFKK